MVVNGHRKDTGCSMYSVAFHSTMKNKFVTDDNKLIAVALKVLKRIRGMHTCKMYYII